MKKLTSFAFAAMFSFCANAQDPSMQANQIKTNSSQDKSPSAMQRKVPFEKRPMEKVAPKNQKTSWNKDPQKANWEGDKLAQSNDKHPRQIADRGSRQNVANSMRAAPQSMSNSARPAGRDNVQGNGNPDQGMNPGMPNNGSATSQNGPIGGPNSPRIDNGSRAGRAMPQANPGGAPAGVGAPAGR